MYNTILKIDSDYENEEMFKKYNDFIDFITPQKNK